MNFTNWIRRLLPITELLSDYSMTDLRGDALAGVTVGVMVIPQGMAYAVIAGIPPIYGLYAALVPLFVYPIIGSSRHLSWGPTALDMIVVAAGLSALAVAGTDRYIELAILLTAMVGGLQIIMGFSHFGFVATLLSRPVITGLSAAAAFIIAFSQLGNLLGIELARSEHVYSLILESVDRIGEVHAISLAVGGISILILIAIRWWNPILPRSLFLVILGTFFSWALGLQGRGVEIIGEIPTGLPEFDLPAVNPGDLRMLLPAAVTLALVQFMNVVSLGRVFAKRHRYTIDANRELLGMGSANLLGSFFNSIPSSGSFSRSAVSEQAGGRTSIANIFIAAVIAMTLLFLTPLFYYLPMPVLAVIIIAAGFKLIEVGEIRALFLAKERDGYIALFTALCTLIIGIQEGVLLGIGASIIAVLYRISRPHVAELGHVPGTQLFRDLTRFDQASRLDEILVLRVDASFSFANAEYFKGFILDSEKKGSGIRAVIIDGTSINDLDTTAVDALISVIETLEDRGIELYFTGLIGPVREVVVRSGLFEKLGENRFHMGPHHAVAHVLRKWDEQDGNDRLKRYLLKVETAEKKSTPAAS